MRDDEVGVLVLRVHRRGRMHHAAEPADREHRDESERHQRTAVVSLSDPPYTVEIQLKIFTPVGTAISIVLAAKNAVAMGPSPVVNMWCAHTVNDEERDAGHRVDHERIAEKWLAREDRQDLRDDAHGGQDQDVHLRVSEHPEEVLPEDRVRPVLRS